MAKPRWVGRPKGPFWGCGIQKSWKSLWLEDEAIEQVPKGGDTGKTKKGKLSKPQERNVEPDKPRLKDKKKILEQGNYACL